MTQENASDGSENPDRFPQKRDNRSDDDSDHSVPNKKKVRVLPSDDLKKVTPGLIDAGKGHKLKIILTRNKRSTDDGFSASKSESGGAGNEPGGDGGGKHTAAGGSGSCSPQTAGTTVPPTDQSGQTIEGDHRVEEVVEAAVNAPASGEEQTKGDLFYSRRRGKQMISLPEEKPAVDDQWNPEDVIDFSGDWMELTEEVLLQIAQGGTTGDDASLPTDTGHEIRGDGNGEEEEEEERREEEVQIAVTEAGEMSGGGESPKDDRVEEEAQLENVNDQLEEGEILEMGEGDDDDDGGNEETVIEDDGIWSPIHTVIQNNNGGGGDREEQGNNSAPGSEEATLEQGQVPLDDGNQAEEFAFATSGSSEGDHHHEQGQLAEMEDGGSEPELVQEERDKGKEPLEEEEAGNQHEQEQQHEPAIEDGGDADVVSGPEELQDRKGKKPMEYVESSRKDFDCNQNPPDFASSDSGSEDPGSEIGNYNNPDVANSIGYMASIQGDMIQIQYPITTIEFLRKRTRSIHELGESSNQEARKKPRHGGDVESSTTSLLRLGYNEPPLMQQAANDSLRLFGVTINPSERRQEHHHHVARNSTNNNGLVSDMNLGLGVLPPITEQPPANGIRLFGVYMTQGRRQVQPVATRGIRLFGVNIGEEQEQVQSVGMQNGGRGNSHGGRRESSRQQRPKSGLRLFGVDIQ